MRAIVQRAAEATVTVDGEITGSIGRGLCVFVGVTHSDQQATAVRLAGRLAKLRIFPDEEGKMNRSVQDIEGEILAISQFTLYGDTRKGNRPGYSDAARPDQAEPLIDLVVETLRSDWQVPVQTGRFGADMAVSLINDGPITLSLDIDA